MEQLIAKWMAEDFLRLSKNAEVRIQKQSLIELMQRAYDEGQRVAVESKKS